jgi:hypothetical protein
LLLLVNINNIFIIIAIIIVDIKILNGLFDIVIDIRDFVIEVAFVIIKERGDPRIEEIGVLIRKPAVLLAFLIV